MTTRKTTPRTTTTKKPTARKAATAATDTLETLAAAPAKTPARATKKSATPHKGTYCLHLGQGFSLLTQKVPGGLTTAARVPAGAALELSYWKEPSHPQHPEAKLTRITMHARVDGAALPSLVVAQRDDEGRLLRLSPTLELPATSKLLEYWFELETDAEQTLWDSNWGNNHWLELESMLTPASQAEAPAHAEA